MRKMHFEMRIDGFGDVVVEVGNWLLDEHFHLADRTVELFLKMFVGGFDSLGAVELASRRSKSECEAVPTESVVKSRHNFCLAEELKSLTVFHKDGNDNMFGVLERDGGTMPVAVCGRGVVSLSGITTHDMFVLDDELKDVIEATRKLYDGTDLRPRHFPLVESNLKVMI